MLEETTLDLIIAIYIIIIAIVFGIMYTKGGLPFLWFLSTIFNAFGSIIFYFRHFDLVYRMIANIFYFLAAIALVISVIQEYCELLNNGKKNQMNVKRVSKSLAVSIPFLVLIVTTILVSMAIVTIVMVILLFKIYLRKKSITHLFMLLTLITGLLLLFFSILSNFNVQGAWETAVFMKIIFYTNTLAVGLSAPIDKRLNETKKNYFEAYNRAEFYKDLFAHDISNILQSVQTSMDLFPIYLEKPDDKKEIYNLIDILKSQVIKGADLVTNIRKLSEIEEVKSSTESIEVCQMIKDAIKYLKKVYENKELVILFDSSDKKYFVKANKLLLNVFENILINSVKHNNNPVVEILIRISKMQINNNNYIEMEFIDNGIGIPDDLKEKIFQRAFMKGRSVNGMGLGLSLVQKIIEKCDGRIWVENKIKGDFSRGSNFIITIPEV